MHEVVLKSSPSIFPKGFLLAFMFNLIWINASEVFRYFAFIMPMMRETFSFIPDVAPMNIPVFLIWGVWDTILVFAATFICWLMFERFGHSLKIALYAGTAVWLTIFVILWLGLFNMNLATPSIVAVALPLAWFEMFIAACIVRFCFLRSKR